MYKRQLYQLKSHISRWKRISEEAGISNTTLDSITVTYRDKKFHVNKDSFSGHMKHLRRTEYNIYTDGSKLDGNCGTGFAIYRGNKLVANGKRRLPESATVFQAEINGIKMSCEKMIQEIKHYKPKYIKIFSDSQAALLAINSSNINSRAVLETIKAMNELAKHARRVTLVWIKAHVGHKGNELADRLAKEGTLINTINNDIHAPLSSVKNQINKFIRTQWDKEWQSYKEARR